MIRGSLMCSVFLSIVFSLVFLNPLMAAQEMVHDYPVRELTAANAKSLLADLEAEHAQLLKKLQKEDPDKVKKSVPLWAYERIIAMTRTVQAGLKENAVDPGLALTFNQIQRVHYSVLADLGGGAPEPRIKRLWQMSTNVGFGPLKLNVPDVIIPSQALGRRVAGKESLGLFDQKGSLVSPDQYATLSALDISRLQPRQDHFAILPIEPGNHYEAFLRDQVERIKACSKKYEQFDLTYARRVLFFDELKEDATSPKITAKDRYGLKWKVKWGDEVHTDVALTRIYIDLGAPYTDLKFYSGPGETILVLAPPSETDPAQPKTFAAMADQLLKSKFKFHADRYLLPKPVLTDKTGTILGTGIVTTEMAEKESISPKYVGAYFVTFKECQLSLYNPAIKRLGGASMNKLRATQDRVARSSLVFNAWVKNKDVKDDNTRAGFLFNPQTGDYDQYVEFISDLGCSLGHLKPSGELNSFEHKLIMMMPQTINFFMRPLYIPESWKDCTWADARWMSLRIARLTRADLERAFLDCGWPIFAQKVAVEKLISRRNDLVEAFHLEEDGIEKLPCDVGFSFEVKTKNGVDYPVYKGKINENSEVVRDLEETVHPEGLANIISRKND
ncbi:MAG TPA: hypothetical protein PKO06_10390 [Candidatus Ozemobacteraceae bacterium]|nr:hypothetical protein [Candidatus Ozemobacteraceae bacterium]